MNTDATGPAAASPAVAGRRASSRAADTPGSPSLTRRALLLGAGGLGAVACLALAGCSGGGSPSPYSGDTRLVALAAALENQTVAVYQAALAAPAASGPHSIPALAEFAHAAMRQHEQHAAVWNRLLGSARKPTITDIPLADHASLLDAVAKAGTPAALVRLVQELEVRAAQTHLAAAGRLAGAAAAAAAASIGPVEAMHAATAGFLLGEYSAPGASGFLGVEQALTPTSLTV